MIEKLILTSDLGPLLDELGGYTQVKQYREISSTIRYKKYKFEKKEDYAELTVVQRCLVLLDNIRAQVAVVGRAETERRDEADVPRITSGASILLSSSPFQHAKSILNRAVEHHMTTPIIQPHRIDLVSVNDVKGGYLFLVRSLMVNPENVHAGKEPDKALQFMPTKKADAILAQEKREMERNF